ncbi:MAG: PAS domain S-box protein, partial [Myxococcota bacterium]
MRESPDAPSFSSLPDPFEAYRPRLLLGISAGAAAGLMVVATATGVFRGPLAGLEWAGFWVALALFCTAPLMQRWTSSVLIGVSLLLAGGAVSIFVPAYFAGGLRAPQVIWLLVVPMLAPFYFGFRVTLVSGVLSLAAFTLLFALGLSGALPVASPDTTGFHTFMNLALAIVFVMAVSISTHRAMRQNSQSLLSLKQEIERRSEELAESESRKSAILDSAVAGLISTDADARVVEFNPAASQILGYTREEAIGQKLVDFLIPNSLRDAHSSAYQRAVEHPSPPMSAEPRQLVALCSNGEEIPVEVLLQRIPVAGPSQFMAQLRDLRAERRTEAMVRRREQQLHRAQRLEGVGRLAGGVAHDFNNLLMVIGGYSESIETDPNASDWIREQAREVLRATQQAASITRQLLAFSRGQELTLGAVPLEKLLTEFEPTIRTLLPSEIQLSTNREPARWPVRANWTELERIVINLVMNAVDAMPEGGQLSISTEYLEFAATSSDSPPNLEPGSYARLQVIDDGVGMTPEVLSHAFEPFFTTKEVGKGTGLGLASV